MSQWSHDYSCLKNNPPEFRLVRIHPGVRPHHIVTSLATYPLNGHPPYEALSYVWGRYDLEDVDLIELDGSPFEVTINLCRALYYLRLESETRDFWIDAICINQEDLNERSSQVQLMRDIYKSSTRTVVWIGEESFWSHRLFQFLKSIDKTRGWGDDDERKVKVEGQVRLRGQLAVDGNIQKIVQRGLYKDIAQRDFWTRIWIVQEVAIASKVIVCCGPDEMSWQDFSNSIWNLDQASNIAMAVDNPEFGGLPNLETITIIRELLSVGAKLLLSDVLACLRRAKATDSRDMIYGLLGILPSKSIRPDYSSTPQDLYLSLVDYCIKEEKSLDIITLCRRSPSSTMELPSWVPDWTESWMETFESTNADLPTFPLILKYGSGELLRSFAEFNDPLILRNAEGDSLNLTAFSAHGSTVPVATIQSSPTPPRLTARGVCIDVISHLGSPISRGDVDGELFFFESFLNWEEIMLGIFGIYRDSPEEKSILDVFDRFLEIMNAYLTRNHVEFESERREKLQRREEERAQRERKCCQNKATYPGKCCIVEALVRTIVADLDEDFQRVTPSKYTRFWEVNTEESTEWGLEVWALQMCTNRRLLVTTDGYVGLGPVKARQGDHVCILYGCSVPLIFREIKSGFSLVGEAYVHGFMDGEALALVNEGKLREKEWILF